MKRITPEELKNLRHLANQLFDLGQTVLEVTHDSATFEKISPILHERDLVFEQFQDYLELDLNAIAKQHGDEAVREAASTVIEALQSVVEQNGALSQVVRGLQDKTEENIQRIDHSLVVIKKYYPLLSGQGNQFDDKR